MKNFNYTARDEKGKIMRGTQMAADEIDLANRLANSGYFLTSFKEVSADSGPRKKKAVKINAAEVLNFTIQLSTLVDAGMPLLEGLRELAQEAENEKIQYMIDDIRFRIESGSTLKEALSMHPQTFSKLYVSIVGAGESTGKLSRVLQDVAHLLEWQQELMAKIKESSIYPVILFAVMIGVVLLLVVKVIPIFEPMFEEMGVALPVPTQIVLGVSQAVRRYFLLMIVAAVGSGIGLKFYNNTEKGRYQIDSVKLRLPIFGELIKKIALSRFTHTFVLCFKTGLNLLTTLDIAKDTTGNARIEQAIARAKESVNVGEKLASSLQMTGEFPPLVIRMINVGEQSGALGNTLEKVAEFYDKEVTSTVKRIFALFEPIMIVIMGLVVGGIAMSIFLPLFSLISQVGG